MTEDIRWIQRLDNLGRAVGQLGEAIDLGVENLSELERQGTVQRFEVALELSWKAMKDYLEFEGVKIDPITPRNVVREAFAAGVVRDGQVWIDMLDHRNVLSHNYNPRSFERAVLAIRDRYRPAIEAAYAWLVERQGTGDGSATL